MDTSDIITKIVLPCIGSATISGILTSWLTQRYNLRQARIAHLKEQLQMFYGPIDNLMLQNTHRYKFFMDLLDAHDNGSDAPDDVYKEGHKIALQMLATDAEIRELFNKTSHLMDATDRPIFAECLELANYLSTKFALPISMQEKLESKSNHQTYYGKVVRIGKAITIQRVEKQETLGKLLGINSQPIN